MHILKLVLPLAGLLLAGQGLAHKASRATPTTAATAMTAAARRTAIPPSLLDGVAGRHPQAASPTAAMDLPPPAFWKHGYTKSH
jgi:acyl-CoA reductase-like NAD-dependent aldehyde dehydrogenase